MTRRDCLGLPILGSLIPNLGESSPVRYELTRGVLTSAEHELELGYFSVGIAKGLTLLVVKDSIPWLRLRELRDRQVRVLIEVSE